MTINSQTDGKYSLSSPDSPRKKYGDYNVYGEDILLQPSDDGETKKVTPKSKPEPETKKEEAHINTCEKCGAAILNEDKLCIDCYDRRKLIIIVSFIVIWIGLAVLTDIILGESYTIGSLFACVVLPFLIDKDRYIKKRRLFHSVPVTLDELVREFERNPEFAEKCKKEYGFEGTLKNHNETIYYVQNTIYKKLRKCYSNRLSAHPKYLDFVNGLAPVETDKNTISKDIKRKIEKDKTLQSNVLPVTSKDSEPTISKPRKHSKSFFVILIALIIVSIFSLTTIIYQQTVINEQETKCTELDEDYDKLSLQYSTLRNNYNNLKNDYDSIVDEYNSIEDEYNSIEDEYEFYRYYAVCVNKNSVYYHYYDCDRFDISSFWIYNIDAAKSKGYDPCPECR